MKHTDTVDNVLPIVGDWVEISSDIYDEKKVWYIGKLVYVREPEKNPDRTETFCRLQPCIVLRTSNNDNSPYCSVLESGLVMGYRFSYPRIFGLSFRILTTDEVNLYCLCYL